MKKILLLQILLMSTPFSIFAQSDSAPKERGFSVFIGGTYGIFDPRHEFIDIYGYQIPQLGGQVAVGYNNSFIIGKYRTFKASGSSKVKNITASTTAEWKEQTFSAGFRTYAGNVPLYLDVLYVLVKADESIGTVSPNIPELNANGSIQDRGFGLAVGFTPLIIGPLGISLECEWNYLLRTEKNKSGATIPNLGGLFVSGGLFLSL